MLSVGMDPTSMDMLVYEYVIYSTAGHPIQTAVSHRRISILLSIPLQHLFMGP